MSAEGSKAFWHGRIACETGEASTCGLQSERNRERGDLLQLSWEKASKFVEVLACL